MMIAGLTAACGSPHDSLLVWGPQFSQPQSIEHPQMQVSPTSSGRALPLHLLAPLDPSPMPAQATPSRASQKSQGRWVEGGRGRWGGKGCGLMEGSSRQGRTLFKGQLWPDPHVGLCFFAALLPHLVAAFQPQWREHPFVRNFDALPSVEHIRSHRHRVTFCAGSATYIQTFLGMDRSWRPC